MSKSNLQQQDLVKNAISLKTKSMLGKSIKKLRKRILSKQLEENRSKIDFKKTQDSFQSDETDPQFFEKQYNDKDWEEFQPKQKDQLPEVRSKKKKRHPKKRKHKIKIKLENSSYESSQVGQNRFNSEDRTD